MAMIACKSMDSGEQIYYKTRENKKKNKVLDRGLKTLRFKASQLIKKISRVFTGDGFFHFRSYALNIGIIRDFGHHWKTRVAGTLWFSEALGSAEPEAFLKNPYFFIKNVRKKKGLKYGKT